MGDEYIKRENAIALIRSGICTDTEADISYIVGLIKDIPSADAVPVVRCKECKFAHMTYGGECKYCDVWESEDSLYLDGDFFCAFGERKDNEID